MSRPPSPTGRVTDWRAWLQLLLALVPIVGAVAVSSLYAVNQREAIEDVQAQVQPVRLAWELHQVSSAVSTSFTSLEAAAQDGASSDVLALAEQDRANVLATLDQATGRATVLAASIAAEVDTDAGAFQKILEQTFGMTANAFTAQVVGASISPGLRSSVGIIESRFTGGNSIGTSGWDTEASLLIDIYQALSAYQSAWLIEHRALANAALEVEQSDTDALGALPDSTDRHQAWDDLRVVALAVQVGSEFVLPERLTGTDIADPAADVVAALGTGDSNQIVLDGLAISDRASNDLTITLEALNKSASARESEKERQRVIYIAVAAVLVLLGIALLAMTRMEIRRRQRIEKAHAEAMARLDQKASRDPMTGVWNRRRLEERVDELLEQRSTEGTLVLAYVDLDRFKAINDVWGHTTGDQVLQIAAKRLAEVTFDARPIEVVRSGGDEFVCYVALEEPSVASVAELGAQLIATISEPMTIAGRTHRLGATAGLSLADEDATRGSLMFEADSSLLLAKRNQRGTAAVYNRAESRSSELVQALPDALVDGQIICWYQPVYDLRTGEMSHAEALARWTRPDGSAVRPDEFIPLVESFGLASQLTEVALRNAGQQQAHSNGRRIWINVSPGELDISDFAERFLESIEREQIDPLLLGVEITETAAVSDPVNFGRQLEQLRAVGVTIAIDDFGNGYSPLGYLQDLPIDTVKLDRSLIDQIDKSTPNQHIVRGVVALCQELGIDTVAEGVERAEELDWITEHGITYVQGYLTARPMPHTELDWDDRIADHSSGPAISSSPQSAVEAPL